MAARDISDSGEQKSPDLKPYAPPELVFLGTTTPELVRSSRGETITVSDSMEPHPDAGLITPAAGTRSTVTEGPQPVRDMQKPPQ